MRAGEGRSRRSRRRRISGEAKGDDVAGMWIEVKQGESAESIAYQHGHFVDTVWNHPENRSLARLRKTPHTLFPGDRLFVPAITPREVEAVTERRHVFRRRGVPSRLIMYLHADGDEVLANRPYRLELGGLTETGTTDANGMVSLPVMPDQGDGRLTVDRDGTAWVVKVGMRRLDPISEMSGVQGRLRNLGLYGGEVDGLNNQLTIHAVQMFQLRHGLTTTGRVDDGTRAKLEEVHGC
ncbi:peptidoglycan-binding domain-containing protein [Sorangium sp. So ce887]|uniref:peptidoglycan-binding domain-containing protein n=1 Tax=Sorangium sp. So ce887 TaxID=3133324 RepID=UPI003F62807D